MALARRSLAVAAVAAIAAAAPGTAAAQAEMQDTWRLSAAAGGFVPRSAMIVGADGRNTQLNAGPSFSLDLQYLATHFASVYASGTAAFSSAAYGSEIRPTVNGPSEQVTLLGLTGGVVVSPLAGESFQPTLRIGGGVKGYDFALDEAQRQWRATGDFGLGFRGVGVGAIEVGAEVRYLPSSIDQSRLPTRGIVPQAQRQTDLLFSVGVGVRM
jgi:hypothetical protein